MSNDNYTSPEGDEDVYRDERERASDPDLESPCPPGGLLFDVPDGTSNSPCLHARAQVASSSVTGSVVFSNMATMLRLNLFTYRDLRAWLDEPYETPPVVPRPAQLELNMQ